MERMIIERLEALGWAYSLTDQSIDLVVDLDRAEKELDQSKEVDRMIYEIVFASAHMHKKIGSLTSDVSRLSVLNPGIPDRTS